MAEYKSAPQTEEDEDVKVKSCGDKCGACVSGFGNFCYHDGLYCGQTCFNWAQILACYGLLYLCTTLFTWGLLTASRTGGVQTLWIFFAIFAVAFTITVSGVVYGHITRKPEDDGIE